MKEGRTDRHFPIIKHDAYLPEEAEHDTLVTASSAIDFEYSDGLSHPGTSYLWIGRHHHLNRAEVRQLVGALQSWLDTGRLTLR